MNVQRGDVVLVDYPYPGGGGAKVRPALVIQNDRDNRRPPPAGSESLGLEPWAPTEDDIDAEVRADLDRWVHDDGLQTVGADGPRLFAVTRREALAALDHFVSRDQRICVNQIVDRERFVRGIRVEFVFGG